MMAGWTLMLAGLLACPAHFAVAASVPQNTAAIGLAALPPVERGDLLEARGEYLAAIEAYREVTPDAEVFNKMGIAYHHLLAIDLAKKDYEKALLIRPNYPQAINNLGAAYFAERDYRKSIKLYRKALELMPDSAVVAANLGTAYFARGRFRQGLEAYRVAFRLDPEIFSQVNAQAIIGPTRIADRAHQDYCIAELFAQAGMHEQALDYLRKAIDEGFSNRNELMQDAVFAKLRQTAEFARMMAEEKIR
jgi:tetratricopeptide (TPR) repeat protein